MEIWRICKSKHQATAFSGEGGLYSSGRWHPQGFPIVYTASSLALATLEIFVHLESDRIPLVGIRAIIPDDTPMTEIHAEDLPLNWQETSAYPVLQRLGKQWLQEKKTPVLKVPSAIIPVEMNYLLNPLYPDLRLSVDPPIPIKLDQRMWKSKI